VTVVPLPPNPTLRVRLIYSGVNVDSIGSRFFLTYAGPAPSAATLNTLAGDIAAAYGTHLQSGVSDAYSLSEIDILDISSETGASGTWSGDLVGGDSSNAGVVQSAVNVEFTIARRYRGGKPRMFFPPPGSDSILNTVQWTAAFVSDWNTAVAEFMAEVLALTPGGLTALTHVNLSYYQGFTNVTNSSGRTRAAPKYRTTPLQDTITGYVTKPIMGSQRRRRTSTTP